MPPLYRLLSVRYLLHRWDRAVLIIASIALGVATLVSSRILTQCIETAATETTTPLKRSSDLFVHNGEVGVLRSVADDLRNANVPGIASVQPLVYERISLPGLDDRSAVLIGTELSFQLLGGENTLKVKVEATREGPLFQLALVYAAVKAGKFTEASEIYDRIPGRLIIVSRALYEERKRRGASGTPIVVRFGSRDISCLPIGFVDVEDDSPLASLGKNFVGMEIGQAARFVRSGPAPAAAAVGGAMIETVWDAAFPQRVNRIDLFFDPAIASKLKPDDMAATVQNIVGGRGKTYTQETQGQSTQEIVNGFQVGFLLCSLGAMVVGLFLVYNALSVTVAERRHDIGILRSIGATRGQIIRLFTIAAVLLGIIGAAFGVPLGIAMARLTLNEFREELGSIFLNPEVDPGSPSLATLGFAMLAGVLTSLLAALVPALQAASDEPADAVRRSADNVRGPWQIAHKVTCATLIAGGVAMILSRHALPHRVGAFGGMMTTLIGLLLAAPIIVGVLVRLVQPILRRVLPIEARLAADNLIRSPGRTGVVIGALGAGVAVMIQTAGVGKSNEVPVTKWLYELVQAEHFVFAGNLASATSSQAPMEPHVPLELAKLPGVERATGLRYVRPEYNDTVIFMTAVDVAPFADATQKRAPSGLPDLDKLRKIAGRQEVVISDNFTLMHGIKPGDTIVLPGPNGPVSLLVADSMIDYSWSRGSLMIDRAVYAKLFRDERVDVAHVFMNDPNDAVAIDRLKSYVADRGLFTVNNKTIRSFFTDLIDRVYKLAYLQQIIVGIVASLGVVTALLISVLQRKRELGLLLAVGATPGQVIRSVLAEAALMGVFGTVLGVLIGLPMQWYVLQVVMVEESGFSFDLLVPWRQAILISIGAISIATLAGLLPALHAVRMRIPDAIAYE